MSLRKGSIARWWPSTQSLDLVEGSVETVADAVESEVRRFIGRKEPLVRATQRFASLDEAFANAGDFFVVPTYYLVLPSRSQWTVLWNNAFDCDGYHSLCFSLTENHGLRTIHWSTHDQCTTFQPGATFAHFVTGPEGVRERHVYVAQEDGRWCFQEKGDPLPEEDVAAYASRRKRDRLNEQSMISLLGRLGAHPWDEEFYDLRNQDSVTLRRTQPPPLIRKARKEVLGEAG